MHFQFKTTCGYNPQFLKFFFWVGGLGLKYLTPALTIGLLFLIGCLHFRQIELCFISIFFYSDYTLLINLLATDFFFQILAHPVFKM